VLDEDRNELGVSSYPGELYIPLDPDSDGVPGYDDNCPLIYNPDQADVDDDAIGDACDQCPNDNENDADADGLCGDIDNCPHHPNGPSLGTCIIGNIGLTCTDNEDCGEAGFCSMNQEDTYPSQGNGIGDVCECESDFMCDGDVDGSDASLFKFHFGRSVAHYQCAALDPCRGDFSCDGDVDGTDAALFKSDFGRSTFLNSCPTCVTDPWCVYP
jgi:hypothetical protein